MGRTTLGQRLAGFYRVDLGGLGPGVRPQVKII